jgi:hypothetical protein
MGVLDELNRRSGPLPRAIEVATKMAALPHSMYGRIKRELRGEALARIDDAISNRNEPMLESWLSAETSAASAMALKRNTEPGGGPFGYRTVAGCSVFGNCPVGHACRL